MHVTNEAEVGVAFVCRYFVERCYGGPEEGGWWYDWHTFDGIEAVVPAVNGADGEAYRLARSLNEDVDNSGPYHRDRFDVNGDADLVYYVDVVPGECQTTERPYYC